MANVENQTDRRISKQETLSKEFEVFRLFVTTLQSFRIFPEAIEFFEILRDNSGMVQKSNLQRVLICRFE